MHKTRNPPTIAEPPPFGMFSHSVEVRPNARYLFISGQSGVRADGSLAGDLAAQAEQTFANIGAVLADAGMEAAHLVKIVTFIVGDQDLTGYREARARFLGDARPAATLVKVSGLAVPGWLIEVEAVAAA